MICVKWGNEPGVQLSQIFINIVYISILAIINMYFFCEDGH